MTLSVPVPLTQLAQVGSSITIEELTPTTPGGKPRRLVLVGGALPFMGQADWGGDGRIVTTWYPGNGTEASQQNLGPQELPSQWSGEWNRTRMGRAASFYYDETGAQSRIVDPHILWANLDAIRRAGARLRVTWSVRGRQVTGSPSQNSDSQVDFNLVREGRIKTLKINPDRLTDIKWSMELHWMSRGGVQDKVANTRRDDDISKAVTAVSDSIQALADITAVARQNIINTKLASVSHLSLGQLEAIAAAPLKAVNKAIAKLRYNVTQLNRAANIAKTLATTPAAVANSVIDFARDTVAVANQWVDESGRLPAELQTNKQKVADLARSTKYFGQARDGMESTSKQGSDLDLRMRQVLVAGALRGQIGTREGTAKQSDILTIYVAKTGDTPQKLSLKFFNNPDQGDAILKTNRLPLYTPQFRPGLILVIPNLAQPTRT